MKTIPQAENPLQACRVARAQSEAPHYTCRTATIGGFLAVFVINERNHQIYTVNHLRRCNCADFQQRCDGRGIVCKHVVLADQHLEVEGAPAASLATPLVDPLTPALTSDLAAEEAHWERVRREVDALWG